MKSFCALVFVATMVVAAPAHAAQQFHDCAEGSDEYVISPDAEIVLPQGQQAGS